MHIAFVAMAAVLLQPLASSLSSLRAAQSAAPARAALDYEYFKSKVQPIFLVKRQGFTRCVVCHSGGGGVGYLQPLAPGATAWDEEQSRKNFDAVSRLVLPGQPLKSRLLMHPLAPAAGGDEFHNGGWQFETQNDPLFQTLVGWVSGQTVNTGGR
jgi:hypothetical protein